MGNRRAVSQTVSGADQFTDWIVGYAGDTASLSIAGSSFSGTVTLQRKLGDGNIRTVTTWTADAEKSYVFDESGEIRLGVKTGEFTSGSVALRIGISS